MRRLRERSKQRTGGATGPQPQSAAMVACDELWTYCGVRLGERRESRWVGTAATAEKDGRRWVGLAVGDRSENTFLRWYDRLMATAAVYCSGRYAVYRRFPQDRRCRAKDEPASRAALLLIRDRRCVGKGGAVNWNAGLHSAFAKQAESADEGYTKSVAMLVYYPVPVCGRQWAKPTSAHIKNTRRFSPLTEPPGWSRIIVDLDGRELPN